MKKFLAVIFSLLLVFTAFMATGCICGMCGQDDGTKVAILLPETNDAVSEELINDTTLAIQSMSTLYAIEYIVRTSSDAASQNAVLDQVIAWNADAIVLYPIDAENEETIEFSKAAVEKGCALLLVEKELEGVTPNCMVRLDSAYTDTDTAIDEFVSAYAEENRFTESRLSISAEAGDITAANREEAKAATIAYLEANGSDSSVNVLVCENDDIALGVLDAFSEYKGKEPGVKLLISKGGATHLLTLENDQKFDVASVTYGEYALLGAVQLACHYALKDSSFGLGTTLEVDEMGITVILGR